MNQERQYYPHHDQRQQPMYNPQAAPVVVVPFATNKEQFEGDDAVIEGNKWRDLGWAIAFWLSVIAMAGLAVLAARQDKLKETWQKVNDEFRIDAKLLAAGIGIGTLFTAMWLGVMTCCASVIIKFCLLLFPICSFIAAVVFIMKSQVLMAIIAAISGVFGLIYAWFAWKRVPFATVCLNIAIAAFYQFKMPMLVNLFCVAFAVACLLFFFFLSQIMHATLLIA